jgi:L-glutamine-phosphate cytidylyltransferase
MVNKLKSIILAAGEGTRLRPLTEKIPKSMVEIFGTTLLERQIDNFKKCMIEDITVVTGYKSNKININEIKCIKNKNYHKTNMVETLFCANNELVGNVIISYGDIIYETKILKKLIKSKEDITIVIDKKWQRYWNKRFDNLLDDAESLKINSKGNIIEIGQKINKLNDVHGQYIGLMKFSANGIKILKKIYQESKEKSKNGKNILNPNIPFEKSYMTDLLQGLIISGYLLKPLIINGGWLELDSITDYKLYQKMYKENCLSELINLDD